MIMQHAILYQVEGHPQPSFSCTFLGELSDRIRERSGALLAILS